MPRFVVLLRGVNVGRGNRVAMADFRQLLEGLGYSDVATLLNSGNAVFTSPIRSSAQHAEVIAAKFAQQFGFATSTIVKSAAEFAAIIEANPMPPPAVEHSRFLVAFATKKSGLQALGAIGSLVQDSERLLVTRQAAYLHCPAGLLSSKVGSALVGKSGMGVTTRNWATVLKLGALLGVA